MAEKIAILGGGVAAMTAAVYLTEQENWQDSYDLTVYQLGWRLGGKGASGRNAEMGQRIEEHGLHVWFGAYVNAFRTMELVYDKLGRPATVPLASWQQAFLPHSFVVLQELIENKWQTWPIDFPEIPGNPADGTLDLHFWQFIQMLVAWLEKFIADLQDEAKKVAKATKVQTKKSRDRHLLRHLVNSVESTWDNAEAHVTQWFSQVKDEAKEIWSEPKLLGQQLSQFLAQRAQDKRSDEKRDHLVVWYMVRKLRRWLNSELVDVLDDHAELRRAYICADLAITILTGMLRDKVISRGFGSINQYDFRQWLTRHGANQQYSVDSAPVRGFYDLVFGYVDGDFARPNVEAGVATLAMLRIMLCYRGGVMWKMQAGMGDVIFAPIYELLKERGVKFEFFHQVDELDCAQDQFGEWHVSNIKMTQQVTLKSPPYEPLVDVKGLPCWPSQPLLEQVVDAEAALIKANQVNLESFWSNYPALYQAEFGKPLPSKLLKVGVDFDKVIFGISVAGLVHLCPKLLNQDHALYRQATEIKAVATQAFQLWLNKTDEQLGFTNIPASEERPILSAYSEPFDTWAGMANLLNKEHWQGATEPANVAYFCGAFPCAEYPAQTAHGFPLAMKDKVKTAAMDKLLTGMQPLWPLAYNANGFDWQVLFAEPELTGDARFDAQYWRVNVDPSERYVLSVAGSSQYRLATDGSQFNNLFLTGDWIKTGVNAGCVEAAVMAGMQTARSISGANIPISGENGFAPFGAV
ncbi:NAD(P)-binding protein [Pseudoalteromonas fenneropenaei]|uniref:NAD(P)-binding protein n=1 Tax=Pseudoalteromonas fenneropenaei TaxID=1737459 RepID=A0ABV7CF31_9GAMM